MGCLNSNAGFSHWFGNIHLSGPCNRSCYFCIGQHMMALDSYNNLNEWPLAGLDEFVDQCLERGVKEVNLTGTNTDPLLYKHHAELCRFLRDRIQGVALGIRTNGAAFSPEVLRLYDKASVSVTSLDAELYALTMGQGLPPRLRAIAALGMAVKVNVVLCDETIGRDLFATLNGLSDIGFSEVNLREPYGQPHIGNPLVNVIPRCGSLYGMPQYAFAEMKVTYWDVHYVEVESVNLYASGRVSETYPITKGHDDSGSVVEQSKWGHGRHVPQWINTGTVAP